MFNFPILPEQASTFAADVDLLFYALTIFVSLFTVGVTAVLIYFGVRFQQVPGSGRKSVTFHSMKVELIWTGIPLVLAIGIFVWGAILFYDYYNVPKNTLDITVEAKQWMWKLQHPNGVREVNQLHIPKGRAVKLTMTSQDVIHSFYVPAFRVKQDVLPAMYSTLWFEPTKVGTYPLFCAEYCGTQHSTMGGEVVVMEPADYEKWVSGGPALTPVKAGEALFQQMGCATCHMSGDLSRGPNLGGVFGHEIKVKVGNEVQTIVANEEYVRESIMNPTAKVVEGYQALMPTFANQLKDEEVLNLVAYIKSLSTPESK
jgi:cytochrome c oxidase subunit 2